MEQINKAGGRAVKVTSLQEVISVLEDINEGKRIIVSIATINRGYY